MVPAAQLRLELAATERVEHAAGPAWAPDRRVHQVQLDLDAGHRLVAGERVVAQHRGERVEAALDVRR
jgi:hypothetical protein